MTSMPFPFSLANKQFQCKREKQKILDRKREESGGWDALFQIHSQTISDGVEYIVSQQDYTI
jgi:hypothetical protein